MRKNPQCMVNKHKKKTHIVHTTFFLIMRPFQEPTDEDGGNFRMKWHKNHYLVMLCGDPQQVGGDSTHFGPLLRM